MCSVHTDDNNDKIIVGKPDTFTTTLFYLKFLLLGFAGDETGASDSVQGELI